MTRHGGRRRRNLTSRLLIGKGHRHVKMDIVEHLRIRLPDFVDTAGPIDQTGLFVLPANLELVTGKIKMLLIN